MTTADRVAEAIRGFRWHNYGLDDVDPRSEYAEWVPDLAEQIARALGCDPAGVHVYLSTGCLHAQAVADPDEAKRLHGYCQSMTGMQGAKRPDRCKHCDARCVCECHKEARP